MSTIPNPASGNDLGILPLIAAGRIAPPLVPSSEQSCKATESGRCHSSDNGGGRVDQSKTRESMLAGPGVGRTRSPHRVNPAPQVHRAAQVNHDGPPRKLNRVAEVRKSQGVSPRTFCKRLSIDVREMRRLEDPETDLKLSELSAIQIALDVPLIDLLEDSNSLSRPVEERAKLVKIMKSALALRDCKLNARAERLAAMLCDQLVELMPELSEITSWPEFGSRRSPNAVARILAQEIDLSQINVQD